MNPPNPDQSSGDEAHEVRGQYSEYPPDAIHDLIEILGQFHENPDHLQEPILRHRRADALGGMLEFLRTADPKQYRDDRRICESVIQQSLDDSPEGMFVFGAAQTREPRAFNDLSTREHGINVNGLPLLALHFDETFQQTLLTFGAYSHTDPDRTVTVPLSTFEGEITVLPKQDF